MSQKKKIHRVKIVKTNIRALVGFTKLMETYPGSASDMVIARFANTVLVTQFRGKKELEAGVKPRRKMKFWIYAVKVGERVNRSLIYKIKQPIESLVKRFGQKVSWGRDEVQVVEYKGQDYIVKGGTIHDVFAFVPSASPRISGVRHDYTQAFQRLKEEGVNLKDAKLLEED